jgi:hypothetical protein
MRTLTSALVNIYSGDNSTLQDAFQFGVTGDVTWSFAAMTFEMSVKASRDDVTPLVTFTSDAGQIIVDDVVARVLHLNVPDTTLQADLPPAEYVYDLIMIDGSMPPIRTALMQGHLTIVRGVTET